MSATNGYMTADELAALVDCKPNQRARMITWLRQKKWKYEVASSGVPKVARAYHDRMMGIIDDPKRQKYADEPNFKAFAN